MHPVGAQNKSLISNTDGDWLGKRGAFLTLTGLLVLAHENRSLLLHFYVLNDFSDIMNTYK